MPKSLMLSALDERLAICRLDARAKTPAWALEASFFSITRTPDELSIVCSEKDAPEGAKVEGGWRAFKVEGPLDFSLTGILASLAAPLAEAGVGIFAVSTYDTDYVLVKESKLDAAIYALEARGMKLVDKDRSGHAATST